MSVGPQIRWLAVILDLVHHEVLMQRKPFYLIAREEDLRTFRNLILRRELPKVYLSYPITGASFQAVVQFADSSDSTRLSSTPWRSRTYSS